MQGEGGWKRVDGLDRGGLEGEGELAGGGEVGLELDLAGFLVVLALDLQDAAMHLLLHFLIYQSAVSRMHNPLFPIPNRHNNRLIAALQTFNK